MIRFVIFIRMAETDRRGSFGYVDWVIPMGEVLLAMID